MNISEYLKMLKPSFEANELKQNINNLTKEMDEYTIPSFETLSDAFGPDWKFKNDLVKQLDKDIVKTFQGKAPRDANSLELVLITLRNMQTTLPYVRLQIEKVFSSEVSMSGLTFDRATLIQYVEVADFFVAYARTYFNYVSATEVAMLDGSRRPLGVAPSDDKYLETRRYDFAHVMTALSFQVTDLKTSIRNVPTSIVNPDNEEDIKVVVGAGKMDPFGFATLPFPMSMIFRIGLVFVDHQVSRLDRAQAEANALEYRSIVLQQLIENGQADALAEKQLRDAEDDLIKVRRSISKMEEEYGA